MPSRPRRRSPRPERARRCARLRPARRADRRRARRRGDACPFSAAELAARAAQRRVPRPARPARPARARSRCCAWRSTSPAGSIPRVHKGVGYLLRDEWTIDAQPFATAETLRGGLVARPARAAARDAEPSATASRTRRWRRSGRRARRPAPAQRASRSPGTRSSGSAPATSACSASAWDWSRSASNDGGLAALGEFGPQGLGVIAYSRAVRFGTLGVCPQR